MAYRGSESKPVQELRSLQRELGDGFNRVIASIQDQDADLRQLRSEIEQSQKKMAELEKQRQEAEREAEDAEQKVTDLQRVLQTEADEKRDLADKKRKLENKQKEDERKAAQLQVQIDDLKGREIEQRRQLEDLDRQVAEQAKRATAAEKKAEELKKKQWGIESDDVFDGSAGTTPGDRKSNRMSKNRDSMAPSSSMAVGSFESSILPPQREGDQAFFPVNGESVVPQSASGLYADPRSSVSSAQPLTPNVFVPTSTQPGNVFAPGQGLTCTPEYLHQAMQSYDSRLRELKQAADRAGADPSEENLDELARCLKAYTDESRRTVLALSCIPPGADLEKYDELQAKARQLQEETAQVARSVRQQGANSDGPDAGKSKRQASNALNDCQKTSSETLRMVKKLLPTGHDVNPDDIKDLIEAEMKEMDVQVKAALQQLEVGLGHFFSLFFFKFSFLSKCIKILLLEIPTTKEKAGRLMSTIELLLLVKNWPEQYKKLR